MIRKARVWMGATFLAIVLLNYLAIGIPLYNRIGSIDKKVKIFTKNMEDDYIIGVLKKEAVQIDRKIVMLNCVAASVAIIIASWMAYGLIVYREDRRKV
jgi:hypothetical protein